MIDSQILLHLSTIDTIGGSTIQKCIERMRQQKLPFSALYKFSIDQFIAMGFREKQARLLVHGLADNRALEEALHDVNRGNAGFVTFLDDEYPELLRNITGAPPVLFYQGDISVLHKKTIGFVGARKAHGYSRFMAEQLIKPLVQNDWCIVSGGAFGADSYAHEATLACGGKTAVVLGGGLLHWAPRQHSKLFEKIIQFGGVIVSSYPMNQTPRTEFFPARNRIITGLSRGCVVLQAGRKSGALITAQYALEQGREVFAVPGLVNDELSVGPHRLIQQGAKLVMEASDIIEEFDVHHSFMQKGIFDQENEDEKRSENGEHEDLLCYITKPTSIDDLLAKTGLGLDELQDKLFQLSLAGVLEQDFGGSWRRI